MYVSEAEIFIVIPQLPHDLSRRPQLHRQSRRFYLHPLLGSDSSSAEPGGDKTAPPPPKNDRVSGGQEHIDCEGLVIIPQ